jgi:GTP-binding nuclear protein Ran
MRTFKMMIVGDAGSGKTQFVNTNTGINYTNIYTPTVGRRTQEINVDELNVKFEVIDFPGQERYRRCNEIEEANIVLVFVDLNSILSYKNMKHWIQLIRSKCNVSTRILVCGSKVDTPGRRKVTEAMLNSIRVPYVTLSTRRSIRVNEPLSRSIELIDEYERRVRESNHIKVNHLDLCNDIKFCLRRFF